MTPHDTSKIEVAGFRVSGAHLTSPARGLSPTIKTAPPRTISLPFLQGPRRNAERK